MIIIVGAGLSGLLTGYLLKKEGIQFKIIEARNRVGGRVNTIFGTNNTPIEMGATWFTNQHKHLITLLEELDIDCFKQHMGTSVFYQHSAMSPAQEVQIPSQPPSYRISGGTSNLINTLVQKLDKKDILLNQSVVRIKSFKNTVQVFTESIFEGDKVVLTIPPKLWAKNILFEPDLPIELINVANQTHTWMEDSIKVALTYNNPFWQEVNLPGTLFSNVGPVTELYDHCNHQRSKYALCGFINSSHKNLSYQERRKMVIMQITATFGVKSKDFIDYEECVWSKEKNTFEATEEFIFPHQNNGNPIFNKTYFDHRLVISGSETASEFPGYLNGAVISAYAAVNKITREQQ